MCGLRILQGHPIGALKVRPNLVCLKMMFTLASVFSGFRRTIRFCGLWSSHEDTFYMLVLAALREGQLPLTIQTDNGPMTQGTGLSSRCMFSCRGRQIHLFGKKVRVRKTCTQSVKTLLPIYYFGGSFLQI